MRILFVAVLAGTLLLSGCSTPQGTSTPGTSAPSSATGTADPSGGTAALVVQRCTRCHTLARIKAARHDEAAWRETVDRMRGRGAAVDEAQAEAVAKFLAAGGASEL